MALESNPNQALQSNDTTEDDLLAMNSITETPKSAFRRTVMEPEFPTQISQHHIKRTPASVIQQNQFGKRKWLEYSVWTLWAITIMIVFGLGGWAFPDGGDPTTCSPSGQGNERNSSICGLQASLSKGSKDLLFLTSFVLAGFLASTRSLWLARRTAYCALCGATRNLLINLTTLTPPDDHQLLARWAVLGFELSVLKARSLIDACKGREYLELCGLIHCDEWETMVHGDRHTTVWYWIQAKAKQLKDQGQIDAYELQTICNAVTLSRDMANDLMSPINRDQPAPYIFVCAVLVNVNLILASTASGFEWSTWMNDAEGFKVFMEPRLWSEIIILYAFTSIFALLFDMCSKIYNPFGPRDFDIPHNIVGKGIRHLGMSLSDTEGGCIPKSMNQHDQIFLPGDERTLLAERSIRKRVSGFNDANKLLPDIISLQKLNPTFLFSKES